MPHALNKRAIKMRKPGDDAEITADARLIAAAPELVEALQCALVDLELTAGLSTTTRGVIRHMSISKVRDALYRASGQNR